jgi:hypothetical protein
VLSLKLRQYLPKVKAGKLYKMLPTRLPRRALIMSATSRSGTNRAMGNEREDTRILAKSDAIFSSLMLSTSIAFKALCFELSYNQQSSSHCNFCQFLQ